MTTRLRKQTFLFILLWSCSGLLSLSWNLHTDYQKYTNVLRKDLLSHTAGTCETSPSGSRILRPSRVEAASLPGELLTAANLNRPLLLSHLGLIFAGYILIFFFNTRLHVHTKELSRVKQKLSDEIALRKKIQDQLRNAENQREKQIAAQTRELSQTKQQLNRTLHERVHIEKALTMIYDEFYQLFNSAPEGILVIDRHFDIIRANQAFTELCGLTTNKIIGQKCYEILSGPTCHTSTCPLNAIFKGEQHVEIECDKIILAKKQNIPCIITATPFREADGTLIGAIMAITDISSRRRAELALKASTKRLQESNQALEDFVHIISHDLQEPLMLIQAFSQRLQEKTGHKLSHQSSRYLDQIHSAADRMRELINGLLLYAGTSNKTDPFVQVDLSTVIDEVLETLALQIEKSNSIILRDRLPAISGDPLQIRQLFQNIIGNSLKYRNKGIHHEIHIRYKGTVEQPDGSNQVEISIRDNGIGFNPEAGQYIFDIFERLQTGKEVEGTGIGLAICKRIVARHGGRIRASGHPGQGAEFIIYLPVTHEKT